VLAVFIHRRQPGRAGTKLAAAAAFAAGILVVGSYFYGVARMFVQPADTIETFAALVGGCGAVSAAPIVLTIAVLLVRGWVRLANLASEQAGTRTHARQNCDSRGAV
jgi:hypothetical protein